MTRRTFLAATAGATVAAAAKPPFPVIDTHIHLFDPARPGGIPWPPADDEIRSKPTYPSRFRELTRSLGITGAIEVECSPELEDNQWVLDVARDDTIMVGTVGFLDAGKPGFAKNLERFTKNPLFRGLRYGNLWGRSVHEQLSNPAFLSDMKRLAAADLSLDTANPDVEILEDMLRISDHAPDLRIVVDHLPKIVVAKSDQSRYQSALREFAKRKQTYVKVSAVLLDQNGKISYDLNSYRPKIDEIYETFGPDRVLYGSDWPNSDPLGSYAQVFGIVREYFEEKGRAVEEKYFYKNSMAAYKWVKR